MLYVDEELLEYYGYDLNNEDEIIERAKECIECFKAEYDEFKKNMLKKTKREIYNSADNINLYSKIMTEIEIQYDNADINTLCVFALAYDFEVTLDDLKQTYYICYDDDYDDNYRDNDFNKLLSHCVECEIDDDKRQRDRTEEIELDRMLVYRMMDNDDNYRTEVEE